MPELPEVETVVRDLRAHGLEQAVIREVEVFWPRTAGGASQVSPPHSGAKPSPAFSGAPSTSSPSSPPATAC
jgi:hypothetical protein